LLNGTDLFKINNLV